jgi:hypothetical protein
MSAETSLSPNCLGSFDGVALGRKSRLLAGSDRGGETGGRMITYRLAGKTALVTGGSSGIGLATSAMPGRNGAVAPGAVDSTWMVEWTEEQ